MSNMSSNNKRNKTQRVLSRLRKKTLTPIQAWQELGVYDLRDHVYSLRNEGHNITTKRVMVEAPTGEEVSMTRYSLQR